MSTDKLEQIPDGALPGMATMTDLRPALQKDASFEHNEDDSLQAVLNVWIPRGAEDGQTIELPYTILGNRVIKQDAVQVMVANKAPVRHETDGELPASVKIDGMPGSYTPAEDVLTTLYGTNMLAGEHGLFSDPELPEYLTITLTADDMTGLELLQDGQALTADADGVFHPLTFRPLVVNMTEDVERTLTFTVRDGEGENANEITAQLTLKAVSSMKELFKLIAIIVAALIVLIIVIMIIRQICKPKFEGIRITTVAVADAGDETGRRLLDMGVVSEMDSFGKKPITLTEAMVLTHQPPLSKDVADVADDVRIFPGKNSALVIRCGKKAVAHTGKRGKEVINKGNSDSIRIGDITVLVKNCQ